MSVHNTGDIIERRYTLRALRGTGTYASVFEALDQRNSQLVALKIMVTDDEEGVPSTAIRESSLLFDMNHPNIIKLFEVLCPPTKELILVTELFEADLSKYILNQRVGHTYCPSLKDIKFIVYQVLSAVAYLHSHRAKITHRDIKPQNILMNPTKNLFVKLADFGLARNNSIPVYSGVFSSQVVTLWYRAPELLMGQSSKLAFGVDIWSIGCLVAELYTGRPLFSGKDESDQLEIIAKKMGGFNDEAWPDISQLSDYNPELSRFPQKDIAHSVPEVYDDDGKTILRSLLQIPTRRSAKTHLTYAWFDSGIEPHSKHD